MSQQWDDKRAWSISQATEQSLRALRPEGHRPTPDEERKLSRLLTKAQASSKARDLKSYLSANVALMRAACESYSRHLRDPQSSPELHDARSTRAG